MLSRKHTMKSVHKPNILHHSVPVEVKLSMKKDTGNNPKMLQIKVTQDLYEKYQNIFIEKPTTGNNFYFCNICVKIFETERLLNYHLSITHRPLTVNVTKGAYCDKCRNIFDEKLFSNHAPCSKEPFWNAGFKVLTKYSCCICYKECLSEKNLLIHCKIIHRPITTNFLNKTNCAFCETCEVFYEEDSFAEHFPCNAVDIRCFFCLTTMPLKSHYSSHNLTYHSWRKFQCNLCETDTKEMTFTELNEHIKLHNNFGCGVYKCVKCNLFMDKSLLTEHMDNSHKGCRCFNEMCHCDNFNEAFYIKKILKAEEATSSFQGELNLKHIPTSLPKVESEPDNTFLEDNDENWRVEFEDDTLPDEWSLDDTHTEDELENLEDVEEMIIKQEEIYIKEENLDLSEDERQILSNLKSEENEPQENYQHSNSDENIDEEIPENESNKAKKMKYLPYINKKNSKLCECVVCGSKFDREIELHFHGVSHHRPWAVEILKTIFCAQCKSWFDSEYEYRTHHPCTKVAAASRCQICNMQFPFKEHFSLHNVNFNSPRRLACMLCEDSSTEYHINELNKHRQTKHNQNGVFECLKCGVNFRSFIELKVHLVEACINNEAESMAETYKLKINSRDVPEHFKCKICNKIVFRIYNFKQHMAKHNTGANKLCKICGKIFKNINNYKKHLKYGHLKSKTNDCDKK